MPKQKLIKRAVAALLIAGAVAALWLAWGLPPPRLLIEHGGAGGPTGRTREIAGVRFIEISSGYFRSECDGACEPGDLLGKLLRPLGVPVGIPPRHSGESCGRGWVEIPRALWVAENAFDAVKWADARTICSEFMVANQSPARLPTSDEWEYLCYAGRSIEEWREDSVTKKKHPWGITGIGQSREWCEDTGAIPVQRGFVGFGARTERRIPVTRMQGTVFAKQAFRLVFVE